MFKACWEQCGKPTYFPFTCNMDPNSLFNPILEQVVRNTIYFFSLADFFFSFFFAGDELPGAD